jgi:tetratricopeptide (TPR) repeat protein
MADANFKELSDCFFQAREDGHLLLALEIADQLRKQLQDSPIWTYLYAKQLARVGRLEEAAALFLLLPTSTPKEASRRLVALADVYEAKGMFSEAEAALTDAAAVLPDDTAPWIYLGTFQMRRERLHEAIESLKRGLTAEGDVDEVHFNLGGCYMLLDQLDQAETHYARAIEIDPEYEPAKNRLSDLVALKKFRSRRETRGE